MTKETQQQTTKSVPVSEKRIKPTQVVATALAAVTAAFLGSRLGVAGTVTGAGVASIVSTLGGAVYQSSLDRTSRRVAKVAKVAKVRTARRGRLDPAADQASTQLSTQLSTRPATRLDRTQPHRPSVSPTRTGDVRTTNVRTNSVRAEAARLDAARVDGTPSAEPKTEVMGAWAPTRRFEPVRRPDPIADATTEWLSKPTEVFHRPTEVADRPTGVFHRPANAAAPIPAPTRSGDVAAADAVTSVNGAAHPTEAIGDPDLVGPPPGNANRRRLLMAGGATVLAFVLGMGVVTGIELLDDHPFSGGNTGTTIGSLFGGSTQQPTKHPVTPTHTPTSTPTPTTAPSTPSTSAPTTAPTTTNTPATSTPSSQTTTPSTGTSAPTTTPVVPTGKGGAP
ncbi:MAG TPA: hypothetical protein VHX38_40190 [Pseudonocardiaceae bacterium]|jgi:hypothetical protein|nr:hypothetical protein [Pseudonocardiaceae bacterium]